MLERELTLFKFNRNYLRMLAGDLDEAQLDTAAVAGGNTPRWILGHLAVSTDYAGHMLGLKRACPREWHKHFAPGTKPADLQPPLPTKEELVGAIEAGYTRIAEAAPSAAADVLGQPHQVEILAPTVLKTNGDVLAHLLCTHFAFHLAQLSACRRAGGKPPIV